MQQPRLTEMKLGVFSSPVKDIFKDIARGFFEKMLYKIRPVTTCTQPCIGCISPQARTAVHRLGLRCLRFCIAVCCWQLHRGKYLLPEHPLDALNGRLISALSRLAPGAGCGFLRGRARGSSPTCHGWPMLWRFATVTAARSTLGYMAALHQPRKGALRGY